MLVKRAQKLRKETDDDRYWAPLEKNKKTFSQHVKHVLARPFLILFREPMLIAITLYMSVSLPRQVSASCISDACATQFIYGVMYLLFEAYPIVFTRGHGFNAGISGLMFMPIFVGGVIGVAIYLAVFNPAYARAMKRYAPAPVPPEFRLGPCLWAAPIYTISFFWFGWTSYPTVSYWAPVMAGVPMGMAIVFLFNGLFNYTIDAYLFVAASALSSMTVVRSLFGAGFPLFATQMYDTLNPRWASTLLGLIALVLTPIPFILIKFGGRLRRKSKYAPNLPPAPKPQASTAPSVIEEKQRPKGATESV